MMANGVVSADTVAEYSVVHEALIIIWIWDFALIFQYMLIKKIV